MSEDNNTPLKNPCGQCLTKPSIYKCPRCLVRTCSLACVKAHKNDSGCNGIREKTAFVPMEDFSDINLLNDYRYLEDTSRVAEHCKRNALVRQRRKPLFLQFLIKEAHKRKIKFRAMPYPMHRRKNNSSFYYKKIDSILWDITWVFPQTAVFHTEKRVSEKMPVSEAFQKILSPGSANPTLLCKLKPYRTAELKDLYFYMKQELRNQGKMKYYKLCAEDSLQNNLSGKVVLEHPIIHVLFQEETSEYLLVPESQKPESEKITNQAEKNLQESESEKDKSEETAEAPEELPISKVEISTVS